MLRYKLFSLYSLARAPSKARFTLTGIRDKGIGLMINDQGCRFTWSPKGLEIRDHRLLVMDCELWIRVVSVQRFVVLVDCGTCSLVVIFK